jgi:hypothetical protein
MSDASSLGEIVREFTDEREGPKEEALSKRGRIMD